MHERERTRRQDTMVKNNQKRHRVGPSLERLFRSLGHWCGMIAVAVIVSGFLAGANAGEPPKPATDASKVAGSKEAPLVVWNQAITVFRSSFAGLSAEQRAAQAAERIQALPLGSESAEIKVEPATIGREAGRSAERRERKAGERA